MDNDKKVLPSDEICAIISVCSKSGVKTLTYGDLHIVMIGEGDSREEAFDVVKEDDTNALPQQPDQAQAEDLDLLKVEDPELWEALSLKEDE